MASRSGDAGPMEPMTSSNSHRHPPPLCGRPIPTGGTGAEVLCVRLTTGSCRSASTISNCIAAATGAAHPTVPDLSRVARALASVVECPRRSPEPGAWSLEPGAWSLEPGAWSLEPGARVPRPGTRVPGARVPVAEAGSECPCRRRRASPRPEPECPARLSRQSAGLAKQVPGRPTDIDHRKSSRLAPFGRQQRGRSSRVVLIKTRGSRPEGQDPRVRAGGSRPGGQGPEVKARGSRSGVKVGGQGRGSRPEVKVGVQGSRTGGGKARASGPETRSWRPAGRLEATERTP
jgi:hypothetical protein